MFINTLPSFINILRETSQYGGTASILWMHSRSVPISFPINEHSMSIGTVLILLEEYKSSFIRIYLKTTLFPLRNFCISSDLVEDFIKLTIESDSEYFSISSSSLSSSTTLAKFL